MSELYTLDGSILLEDTVKWLDEKGYKAIFIDSHQVSQMDPNNANLVLPYNQAITDPAIIMVGKDPSIRHNILIAFRGDTLVYDIQTGLNIIASGDK